MSLQSQSPSYEQVSLDVSAPEYNNRHTSVSSMSSASGCTSSTYGGNASMQAMNANTTGNSVLSGRVSQSRHFGQHGTFNPNWLPQQTNTMMNVTPWIEQQAQVAPSINMSSLNMSSMPSEQSQTTNLSVLTNKKSSNSTVNDKSEDRQQSTGAPVSPDNSHQPHEFEKDEEDVIPTAIVIKNIPFAIKKEQLLDVMSKLSLPLPYAFNYHFDNGVFRGLAFANFNSTEETSMVVNVLNGREIGGRKLRVEYKKMLPMVERERIEREKREKRGQLEEQHRSTSATSLASLYSISSMPNSSTPAQTNMSLLNNASTAHKLMPDRLYVTLSAQPPSLPSNVDFNDPETLEIYSKLIVFRDEFKNPTLPASVSELAFPLASMNSNQRKVISVLCQFLNLVESFESGFITVRRSELGVQTTGGTSVTGVAGTSVSSAATPATGAQPAFPPSLIRSQSHNLVSTASPLSMNAGRYRQQSPRIVTQQTQPNTFAQSQQLQSATSSPNIFQLQHQNPSTLHHSSSAASLNLLRTNGQTPLGQQLSGGTSGARGGGLPSLGGNAAFFGQAQFTNTGLTSKMDDIFIGMENLTFER
ncbi:hypothetical protein KL935_005291 [Ogataea polymorpha]|nr:hypothetical protein KL935_005291 [Ogataea polymorpha]KAG7909016.1 hypothetical protein KL906_002510 [Ogataea polymorpha]